MEQKVFLLTQKGQEIARDVFRQQLTQYRTERELTQEDLAFISGISLTAISNFERKGNFPKILTIASLTAALNIQPCQLCPLCDSAKNDFNLHQEDSNLAA